MQKQVKVVQPIHFLSIFSSVMNVVTCLLLQTSLVLQGVKSALAPQRLLSPLERCLQEEEKEKQEQWPSLGHFTLFCNNLGLKGPLGGSCVEQGEC